MSVHTGNCSDERLQYADGGAHRYRKLRLVDGKGNNNECGSYDGLHWLCAGVTAIFPSIWPFDLIVGCKALDFESDPNVRIDWADSILVVTHNTFAKPAIKTDKCYGRAVVFKERKI